MVTVGGERCGVCAPEHASFVRSYGLVGAWELVLVSGCEACRRHVRFSRLKSSLVLFTRMYEVIIISQFKGRCDFLNVLYKRAQGHQEFGL